MKRYDDEETVSPSDGKCQSKRRFWIGIIAIILLLIGIAGVTVTCFVLEQKVLQHSHHYGVIFDAGSSHTDIAVYRWPSGYKDHGTAHTEQVRFTKCSDNGISSYESDPDKAGDMIKKCIETIALKCLPHKDVKKTTIYVGATAGMRLLCKRNRITCNKIEESIRRVLNGYKFRQTQNRVRVLTGNEEGTFGWTAANLLNGAFNNRVPAENNTKLIGGLDMGGGSLELTFIPENKTMPQDYTSHLTLYGVNYTLYTHSYLCYGFKEAQRRLMAHLLEASSFSKKVIHPCWQNGTNETIPASWIWLSPCSKRPKELIFPFPKNTTFYKFVGNGSTEACENRIRELFNESQCNYGNCSFNGVYQPELRGHFMAYSGFGHIGSFLNVTKGDQLSKLQEKGDELCRKDWYQFVKENPDIPKKYLRNYCFEALYSYQILTHGFHFEPTSRDVMITRDINGTEVGWSLGFMVNATNTIPVEAPTYRITQQEFIALLLVCCLIAIIGLAMFTICLVKRRMERNMKYKYSVINN